MWVSDVTLRPQHRARKGSSQKCHFCLPKPDDFCQPSVLICKPLKVKSESEVTQSCPTLCDPVDCSLPGFSIHGILQARILEWVTTSFSRGFSPPRGGTSVSCIGGRRFTLWATREDHRANVISIKISMAFFFSRKIHSKIPMESQESKTEK